MQKYRVNHLKVQTSKPQGVVENHKQENCVYNHKTSQEEWRRRRHQARVDQGYDQDDPHHKNNTPPSSIAVTPGVHGGCIEWTMNRLHFLFLRSGVIVDALRNKIGQHFIVEPLSKRHGADIAGSAHTDILLQISQRRSGVRIGPEEFFGNCGAAEGCGCASGAACYHI